MSQAAPNPTVDNAYSAADMQALDGLEAVRKLSGMYIGSHCSADLSHLVSAIADTAIDEALAGFATKVTVAFMAGGSVVVSDNGRGIPTDVNKKVGLTGVEIAYTKLHGGG